MRYSSIKVAVNELLKSKYNYPIYGLDTKEGYKLPSFFTELLSKPTCHETKNFKSGGFTVKITYFQRNKDELDMLTKLDDITELFGMYLKVGERKLVVKEITHDFIGQLEDILQISIEFDYTENVTSVETEEMSSDVEINLTKEEE